MNFNFDNTIPIYKQLVEQLKIAILSGTYKLGEKLPSVRDLAILAKVNPNTMQKALMELENLKLIYTERTNGKYVTEDKIIIEKLKESYAKEALEVYFSSMEAIGYTKKDAIFNLNNWEGDK